MSETQTAQHLIELEIKISHQEIAIEELRQTLFEQHGVIEKLEKSVKLLTERLEAALDGSHQIGPGNEKPPHY